MESANFVNKLTDLSQIANNHGYITDELEIIDDGFLGCLTLLINRIKAYLGFDHFYLDFDRVALSLEGYFDRHQVEVLDNREIVHAGLEAISKRFHNKECATIIDNLFIKYFPASIDAEIEHDEENLVENRIIPPRPSLTIPSGSLRFEKDDHFIAVVETIVEGKAEDFEELLKEDKVLPFYENNMSLVHEIAKVRNLKMMQLLNQYYPKEFAKAPNILVKGSRTALTEAIENPGFDNDHPVADYLLANGWMIENEAPYFRAQLAKPNKHYVEYVVDKGLDMQSVDDEGNTYLHDLLKGKILVSKPMIELFYKKGNPVNAQNIEDQGLIDIAIANDLEWVIPVLKEQGERLSKKKLPSKANFENLSESEQIYWLKYMAFYPSQESAEICNYVLENLTKYPKHAMPALKAREAAGFQGKKFDVTLQKYLMDMVKLTNDPAVKAQVARTLWAVKPNPNNKKLKELFYDELFNASDKTLQVTLLELLGNLNYTKDDKKVFELFLDMMHHDKRDIKDQAIITSSKIAIRSHLLNVAGYIKSEHWDRFNDFHGTDAVEQGKAPSEEIFLNRHAMLRRMEHMLANLRREELDTELTQALKSARKRDRGLQEIESRFKAIKEGLCKYVGMPLYFPKDSSLILEILPSDESFATTLRSLIVRGIEPLTSSITHNREVMAGTGVSVVIDAEYYNQQYLRGDAYLEKIKALNCMFLKGIPRSAIQKIVMPAEYEKPFKMLADSAILMSEALRMLQNFKGFEGLTESEFKNLRLQLNQPNKVKIDGKIQKLSLFQRMSFIPEDLQKVTFTTDADLIQETQKRMLALQIVRKETLFTFTPCDELLALDDMRFKECAHEVISMLPGLRSNHKNSAGYVKTLSLNTEVAAKGQDQQLLSRLMRVASLRLKEETLKRDFRLYGLEEPLIGIVMNLTKHDDLFKAFLKSDKPVAGFRDELKQFWETECNTEAFSFATYVRMMFCITMTDQSGTQEVAELLANAHKLSEKLDWLERLRKDLAKAR